MYLETSKIQQVQSGPLIVIDGQDLFRKDAWKGCVPSHMPFGFLYKGRTSRDKFIQSYSVLFSLILSETKDTRPKQRDPPMRTEDPSRKGRIRDQSHKGTIRFMVSMALAI